MVEAEDRSHPAGNKGQAPGGGKQSLGRRARGRRKKREPGRGPDDQARPALIAWGSRQGAVVRQAPCDCTVQTVPTAAALAGHAGSRLSTDSARSSRAVQGYVHAGVKHTQKEDARGDVHAPRAEGLCALLTPYLRVLRGVSKDTLPGDVGCLQGLRTLRQCTACEQAELIFQAARAPAMARRANKGDCVTCFDHVDLLQTARN